MSAMTGVPSVKLTYFVHGTTLDNERGIATGWEPGALSELGKRQCAELKELLQNQRKHFDIVFCSDLKRAVDSATFVFGTAVRVVPDVRLREVNYGDFTEHPEEEVSAMKSGRITTPFPNGESYAEVEGRVRDFVRFLLGNYAGKRVAAVSHQAPQLALDVIVNGKTWEQAFSGDWRNKTPKEWLPGWEYDLG